MFFDVSELKTLNECGRKWQLTSRNAYHLRPKLLNKNLFFGTLFHSCLAELYLHASNPATNNYAAFEAVLASATTEILNSPTFANDPQQAATHVKMLTAMLQGYYSTVIPDDLARYQVLDIEHGVNFRIPEVNLTNTETGEIEPLIVRGSIDMICLEYPNPQRNNNTPTVWGFEHKTAQKFRPDVYLMMDEQPRTYFIELQNYVNAHNSSPGVQQEWKLGGLYINEVKKVQRSFEYQRRACVYTPNQVDAFYQKLVDTARRLASLRVGSTQPQATPGYMACQMCDMSSVCSTLGYEAVTLPQILEEFGEELEVRTQDHLEEKVQGVPRDE